MSDPLTDLGGWKIGAESFLAAVLQTTAQPIWVVDADGFIRFANPAAIDALGYDTADELLGRPSHETIHHSHPDGTPYPAAECPMLLPRTTGETISRDVDWFFRRDGSTFPVSYVSAPIDVPEGRGAVVAFTDIEERLDVVLGEEQAALRRIATLVAGGADSEEVFATVAREVAHVLGIALVVMSRYEPDGSATVIGSWSTREHPFRTGTHWPLDGPTVSALVRTTGGPVRIEQYTEIPGAIADAVRGSDMRAGAGAPIVVTGKLWGVIAIASLDQELPEHAERRLAGFTELVGTAIANTQAREDLRQLADEQSALRRIATLVARGAEPRVVFDAVAEETGRLLCATTVNLTHFTPDGINVTISGWSLRGVHVPAGTRLPIDGESINAIVRRTARPGRCDSYDVVEGRLAAHLRRLGIRSEVGAPVVVEGSVWGALIAGTDEPEPLPAGTEHRLAEFAELIATAVANATARSALVASRARLVEAADEQRQRVVRDLHDGAQQRLVHAVMTLQLAAGRGDAAPEVHTVLADTRAAIEELRELAHGLHPAILTNYGLAAAVEALADRAPLPVTLDMAERRYPTPVESAAYFVAAEALTNVAKYARARTASVTATRQDRRLVLVVADDGVGGAAPTPGSGLAGLEDRVAALGGTLRVDSAPGDGTTVRAEFPLG